MKLSILAGATSQSVNIFIRDSSSTTGAGLTGLAYNTASLVAYYTFTGANAGSTAITLATLAAVNSAYSSGGFKEIDATNMPGWYRLDLPNAVLATSKGRVVGVHLKGATNMAPCPVEIELTATDNQSATAFITGVNSLAPPSNWNLTSIDSNGRVDIIKVAGTPQTARDLGASVLLSSGTGTGQLDFTSGVVKGNVTQFNGSSATSASGRPEVNATHWNGTAVTTPNTAGTPVVDVGRINNVVTTSVTTVGANVGTTQPVNFSGTGASAYVKGDLEQWIGTAPLALSSQQVQAIVPDTQKVDLNTIKTQAVTCAGAVTIPAATLASTTNITAGTITTVTTLTNAPSDSSGVTTLLARIGGAITISGGRVDANTTYLAGAPLDTTTAQIGVKVVSYASGQAPLQPTTAGRTLDVSVGGEAGVDWANIGSPTTTVALSGTTVGAATKVSTPIDANVTTVAGQTASASGTVDFDTLATLISNCVQYLTSGAALSGSTTTAGLASTASSANQAYRDSWILVDSQVRLITNYNGATRTATFTPAVTGAGVINGTTYKIIPAAYVNAILADAQTHGGTTAKLRLGSTSSTPAFYATNSGGPATVFEATGGNNDGFRNLGFGSGTGYYSTGGATGDGWTARAGATSGHAMSVACFNVAGNAGYYYANSESMWWESLNSSAWEATTGGPYTFFFASQGVLVSGTCATGSVALDINDDTGNPGVSTLAHTAVERNADADALLARNILGGSSTGRTVKEAFARIRNRVSATAVPGFFVIYSVDDTTELWRAAVTEDNTLGTVGEIDPT